MTDEDAMPLLEDNTFGILPPVPSSTYGEDAVQLDPTDDADGFPVNYGVRPGESWGHHVMRRDNYGPPDSEETQLGLPHVPVEQVVSVVTEDDKGVWHKKITPEQLMSATIAGVRAHDELATYEYDGVQINIEEVDKFGWKVWTLYACDQCGDKYPAKRFGLPNVGYSLTDYAGKTPNRVWYLCSLACVTEYSSAIGKVSK